MSRQVDERCAEFAAGAFACSVLASMLCSPDEDQFKFYLMVSADSANRIIAERTREAAQAVQS